MKTSATSLMSHSTGTTSSSVDHSLCVRIAKVILSLAESHEKTKTAKQKQSKQQPPTTQNQQATTKHKHQTKTYAISFSSSMQFWGVMASILESSAAFESRGKSCRLSEAETAVLKTQGVTTLAKLAFAITTPGVNPSEDTLRSLIHAADPSSVVVGTVSALCRFMFDAQTLAVQRLKAQVEGGESSKKELVPAERSERIRKQRHKLCGYDLSGPLECSHSSYDLVLEMAEKDAIFYLQPHKFGTRSAEVAKDRPAKELVIDAQNLRVADGKHSDKVAMSNEFELSQALTRRSLACDLVGICSFSSMERWHRYLFNHLTSSPPPNFNKPTMEQILRADRQAWVKLPEKIATMKRDTSGDLPMDAVEFRE